MEGEGRWRVRWRLGRRVGGSGGKDREEEGFFFKRINTHMNPNDPSYISDPRTKRNTKTKGAATINRCQVCSTQPAQLNPQPNQVFFSDLLLEPARHICFSPFPNRDKNLKWTFGYIKFLLDPSPYQ